MDGLYWKTLLKWMIWGENPLFSETSIGSGCLFFRLHPMGWFFHGSIRDEQARRPPKKRNVKSSLGSWEGGAGRYKVVLCWKPLEKVILSRKLTYELISQKWHFEDDFPFPEVGIPWRVCALKNGGWKTTFPLKNAPFIGGHVRLFRGVLEMLCIWSINGAGSVPFEALEQSVASRKTTAVVPSGINNIAGWKIHHLKMYFLLEKVNFHCHVSLLEGMFYCVVQTGEVSRLVYAFPLGNMFLQKTMY